MLTAILMALAVCASPQQPDTLRAATITSQRSAAAASAAPAQSVTAAVIERSGAKELHEVLRSFAGVSIKDYGVAGGLKTISARGLGSQHTSIVYDGTAVSNAQNGQTDLSHFRLDALAEVKFETVSSDDIFRSARTLSSGSVLTLTSSVPEFGSRKAIVGASMLFGSFGTYNPSLSCSYRVSDSLSISAAASWLSSQGTYPFTYKNGSQEVSEQRLGSDISQFFTQVDLRGKAWGGEVLVRFSAHDSERGLPGSVVYYTQDPTERLRESDFSESIRYTKTPTVKFKYQLGISSRSLKDNDLNTAAIYATPVSNNYAQWEDAANAIAFYSFTDSWSASLAQDIAYNRLDSDIPECSFPRRFTSVSAASAQYRSERLTATATLCATAVSEWFTVGDKEPAPGRFRLCPTFSASYLVAGGFKLRASMRDGFRVPTLNDLYYSRVGNTSLLPEKARQFNLGATWVGDLLPSLSLVATADAYANTVEDKIVAVPTMFIWKMQNVGKVQMYGSDLTASVIWRISQGYTARFNGSYSYLYAVDVTDPSSKAYKNQIQYTPRNSGNFTSSVETPWLTLSTTINAVGERYCLAQNIPANRMGAYCDQTLSASRSWQLRGCQLSLWAEALNIYGQNYEIVRFYPMPGRNYRITLKIKY